MVPSEEVNLNGPVFQKMKVVERSWRFIDHYSNPGPIQFYDHGKDFVNKQLSLSYSYSDNTQAKIKALC